MRDLLSGVFVAKIQIFLYTLLYIAWISYIQKEYLCKN